MLIAEYIPSLQSFNFKPLIIYGGWVIIHYGATHIYSHYCTNWSILGFLTSPLIVSTPLCRGLEWVIHTGSDMMTNMWIIFGTWLSLELFKTK
jgi:hypothetical protein